MANKIHYDFTDTLPGMERSDSAHTNSKKPKSEASAYEPLPDHATGFRNMDLPDVLEDSVQQLCTPTSRNFIVDFGDEEAWVSFDQPAETIRSLLDTPRSSTLHTRWINIWYPFHQRPLLELLAQQYDFSPRLLALMSSDPKRVRQYPSQPLNVEQKNEAILRRSFEDIEKGLSSTPPPATDTSSLSSCNPARTGNLYDIVDGVWHYTSLDQGRSYLCLGFNSLYNVHAVETGCGVSEESTGTKDAPLPHIKRVWTWLLICADKTVISINEDLYPYCEGRLSHPQQLVMMETRRNLINVFRSLSKVEDSREANPLVLLPIRRRLGDTKEETAHRDKDAPGLLFYYLFENWFNSYSLITRRESRYGMELEKLQKEMFSAPKLHHIDLLHGIGNELGALKRHYKSYIRLVDRVTEPQSSTLASRTGSRVPSKASQETFDKVAHQGAQSLMGIGLTSAAIVRFERLRDMISLYALAECKDYLHQKDGLVQMNFQLVAMSQSAGVDRLTRVALLISKATILFLPLTFLTEYVSADLGVTYSVKTYWIAFTVVLTLSWILLMGFGVLSGTMESWSLFPKLKAAWSKVKNWKRKND
ncbi:hypothetical protein E4T42_07395 [Aureobasidium subglaciale]|uniref:Uncharacterized protein n=1 Tax=Aureobasidium subglaciale (strain EXF-2481) TaxID=1043005 RepID=A0A074Y931_AURSE|nr:uncharacterized protein AUEXF2481DRAFT_264515 [Aureobasidium subglaciale EXF-2481]KAI5209754.1 hypothetical protein E4T38_02174 [Aureobasidium subglaciale]KAI5228434.1 hypothetical protein E4T40_01953 [Aureobasidium subglaciale]KAI5231842.1 hypothetical protein E4T41_02173 [Aureobasidium subglaciale]KAI5243304.1 hypothetical protein E4T42_07395 [Aureobasidium subglaciale]KAI5265748.1 hypothetical protein E4T46_01951 [Aureobasidium subglaciale]